MRCQLYPGLVRVQAPAKLNLVLRVLGKRADGFHDLDTLMVSVSLHDSLDLASTASEELELSIEWGCAAADAPSRQALPPNSANNLVLHAAHALRQATGCRRGAKMHLTKRIPMAAGLAGGSSDAAAALVGLNRLWQLGLSWGDLMGLAARLGSDVPFFLCHAGAAVCAGRGERVHPVALARPLHFVIVKPPTGLSTAEVFSSCRPAATGPSAADVAAELASGRLCAAGRCMHNALEQPAIERNPQVARLRELFARGPFLGTAMSGSGSSYFGLCHGRGQARAIAGRLRAMRLGQVFVAQTSP